MADNLSLEFMVDRARKEVRLAERNLRNAVARLEALTAVLNKADRFDKLDQRQLFKEVEDVVLTSDAHP